MKECLTTSPVLGHADYTKPFVLRTDASNDGLGAVLYNDQADGRRVIACASRGLSSSEARYPAHKLGYLALKWSVTENSLDYLLGNKFVVYTDNSPLIYIEQIGE